MFLTRTSVNHVLARCDWVGIRNWRIVAVQARYWFFCFQITEEISFAVPTKLYASCK